jgi:hypothetical protein
MPCARPSIPSAWVQYEEARIEYWIVRKRKMITWTTFVRRVQIKLMKEKTAMHMKKNAVRIHTRSVTEIAIDNR